MTKKIKNINIIHPFVLLFFIVILVQIIVTYLYTNTKVFSIMALIRNISFVLFIYLFIKTKKILYLLLPFLIEFFLESMKYFGYQLDKYIATEYLYSDYFRNLVKKNDIYSNFTEGLYDNIFGIDTLDHSPENLKIILKWGKNVYDNSYKNKTQIVKGLHGKEYKNMNQLKKIGDINKFKKICEICKVHKNMKILEIGFGECDFMIYLKDTYGIKPVGVSISYEQVQLAKSRGFEAHHLDMWDITDQIGKFDLIIQCGNLEYLRCSSESEDKYTKYFNIIQKILKKNGKYFITCIHLYEKAFDKYTLYDYLRGYFLLFGNDGGYPIGKYSLTKHAKKSHLKNIHQEEHTNDYFITSLLYFSSYGFVNKNNNYLTYKGILDSIIKTIADPYYIHSYLCYSPTKDFYWCPFLWEFVPHQRKEWFGTFVTLEYILFQNEE
jgi:ubiquinone/menaquinone biosynthesis C-methylase UbiE